MDDEDCSSLGTPSVTRSHSTLGKRSRAGDDADGGRGRATHRTRARVIEAWRSTLYSAETDEKLVTGELL